MIGLTGKTIINSEVAITFHAFAYKVVYKDKRFSYGEILIDPDRMRFIQNIVKEIPRDRIYRYFRNESLQIDRQKYGSDQDFYDVLRTKEYETLDGKWVKSESEKIICDFLFEHGIQYYYEPECYIYNIMQKRLLLIIILNFLQMIKIL